MTTIDSRIITNCPSCGADLTKVPVMGDFRVFNCPTQRTLSISGTAIQMAHNLPAYMETLGTRIQEARDKETNAMIMADDLTKV